MSIKTIDPAYECYAGIPRQRNAYTGGTWSTVVCIDIGRAPSVEPIIEFETPPAWPPAKNRPGKEKGQLTLALHQHMLVGGPATATQAAKQLGVERYKVQNIFQRNKDLFVKIGEGKYGARRVSG